MTRIVWIFLLFLMLTLVGGMSFVYAGVSDKCQVLFVVDNSRSMARYSAMTRQTVFDLVYDGVQGQMNSGDLYGIWIFNEKVQTNVFTSLSWDAQLNRGLAAGAVNFIKILGYEKQTRLDRLWAELVGYTRQTKKLTVVIITDGTDRFVGTPFDAPINTYCEKHSKEFRQAKKPFIITLAALDGQFLACTVNGARDPIAFDSIASQVYDWKQGQPQYQAKESKPVSVAINEAPVAPAIQAAPVKIPTAGSAAAVVVVQTNTVVPQANAGPVTPIAAPPTSATPAVVVSAAAALEAQPPVIQTNAPAMRAAMPTAENPATEVVVEAAKPQIATMETPTNATMTEPLKAEIAPATGIEKQPVGPPAVEERPVEAAPMATVAPANPTNMAGTHLNTPLASLSVKTAPAFDFVNRTPLIFIGTAVLLLAAAAGLAAVMFRRSRKRPTASFISQSIDREYRP